MTVDPAVEAIGKRAPWRWVVFAFWTAIILYSMDIFRPAESPSVGVITKWFTQRGLPEYTPEKLYHGLSFIVWSILLAGAVARGYLAILSRHRLYICMIALVLFAGLPEGLEHFNLARSPSWADAGLNLCGGAVGLVCQVVVARFWTRRLPASTGRLS